MTAAQSGADSGETRPRALITGASAGIGVAFAERLARDGYDLTVIARRRDRLESLAQRLITETSAQVEVIAADLTDRSALHALEQRIADDDRLAMLVNNAGFSAYMPFVELDPGRAEEQIQLHLTALVRLTRAALPSMIAHGRGDVINVSSMLAFSAGMDMPQLPKRAMYAATKAFINTFTEILSSELSGSGVRVQALCPGLVRTEFHDVSGVSTIPPDVPMLEPEQVVSAALTGLGLGEVICVPALPDPAILVQSRQLQHEALASARSASLAARYRAATYQG